MIPYLVRRFLLAVPTLLLISAFVFFAVRLAPGNVIEIQLGEAGHLNPQQIEAAREELGLDEPVVKQYLVWLGNILQGDFGTSLWNGRPVLDQIRERFPLTAEIALASVVVSLIVAIPVGIISALKQETAVDYTFRLVAILGVAAPNFWIAILIWTLPAIWFGWTPPLGYRSLGEDPTGHLLQVFLPAIVLGTYLGGTSMRLMRSALLEVLREDYIRTAKAKGLGANTVVVRHALRNALIPVITVVGLQFGYLLGGTVVVEQVFALPGLGRLTLDSILNRDYTQLQANILLYGVIIVLVNLMTDVLYGVIDPRIRHS